MSVCINLLYVKIPYVNKLPHTKVNSLPYLIRMQYELCTNGTIEHVSYSYINKNLGNLAVYGFYSCLVVVVSNAFLG